eukprot:329566_1
MSFEEKLVFELGEQPTRIEPKKNTEIPIYFIDKLLKESNVESLMRRGYCLTKIDKETQHIYSLFIKSWISVCNLSQKEKQKYCLSQFGESAKYSSNQFHGYSNIKQLKESFMIRCIGHIDTNNSMIDPLTLIFPPHNNFGTLSLKLYELFDEICRNIATKTLKHVCNRVKLDNILDPINQCNKPVIRNDNNNCYSFYMPNDYISSSRLDCFHYYKPESNNIYDMNRNVHKDSGLMTLIVISDEPALEIYDEKLKCWIGIESLIHKYLKQYKYHKHYNHNYAILFWSRSVSYLSDNRFKALDHRVARCNNERYSVVYKQRTCPYKTQCRYQEDYIIAQIQSHVLRKIELNNYKYYALFRIAILLLFMLLQMLFTWLPVTI